MTGVGTLREAASALRRQWWIVAAVLVVAVVVGYFASSDLEDVHRGSADVRIDVSTQSRVRGMPRPDDVVVAGSKTEIRDAVAAATDLESSEVAASMRVVGKGNPQTAITVTLESETAEAAEAGAAAGAEALVTWVQEAVASDIELKTKQIELTQRALRGLVDWEDATPAERQATMLSRIAYESRLLDLQNDLYITLNVYSFDGEVKTSVVTASSVMRRNLVGAAIAGLVLGLVLAALREGLARLRTDG